MYWAFYNPAKRFWSIVPFYGGYDWYSSTIYYTRTNNRHRVCLNEWMLWGNRLRRGNCWPVFVKKNSRRIPLERDDSLAGPYVLFSIQWRVNTRKHTAVTFPEGLHIICLYMGYVSYWWDFQRDMQLGELYQFPSTASRKPIINGIIKTYTRAVSAVETCPSCCMYPVAFWGSYSLSLSLSPPPPHPPPPPIKVCFCEAY